jgi:hypothetical protein
MALEDRPMPMSWENRVVRGRDGWWVAEVWNPMARDWEPSPDNARWPADREAEARAWVEEENRAQAERNAEARRMLAGGGDGTPGPP